MELPELPSARIRGLVAAALLSIVMLLGSVIAGPTWGSPASTGFDSAVKNAVRNDSDLSHLWVSRSGEFGPDFHDIGTNT
jgi:hypothetical protein